MGSLLVKKVNLHLMKEIYCAFWRIMMYLGAMISKNKTGEKKFGKYED